MTKDYEDEYEEIDCYGISFLQETLHDQKNIRKEDKKHERNIFTSKYFNATGRFYEEMGRDRL